MSIYTNRATSTSPIPNPLSVWICRYPRDIPWIHPTLAFSPVSCLFPNAWLFNLPTLHSIGRKLCSLTQKAPAHQTLPSYTYETEFSISSISPSQLVATFKFIFWLDRFFGRDSGSTSCFHPPCLHFTPVKISEARPEKGSVFRLTS